MIQQTMFWQVGMAWLVAVAIGCFVFLTGSGTTLKFIGLLLWRAGDKVQATQDYFRGWVHQQSVGHLERQR